MPAITFSGLASGIDADAIIKSTVDARNLAIAPFKAQVEFNDKETSALEELNTKLLTLKDSLGDFQSIQGTALSKVASASDPTAISVAAGSAALSQSFTIDIQQIAKAARISFNDRFATTDTPIAPGLAGTATIQIVVGQGAEAQTVSVDVTNTTTLAEVASAINQNASGRVAANVINLGTDAVPQWALVMSSTETGIEKGTLAITVPPELSGAGVFAAQTADQAQDAIVNISGIGAVTRPNNKLTNLIPGVSMELKQAGTGPVQVTVSDDRDKTAEKFGKFVSSANELFKFLTENNKVERVEENGKVTNKYSDLAKVRVDDEARQGIRNAIGDSVSTLTSGAVRVLADLGVSTERDGSLKFDKDKFLSAVAQDAVGAGNVLNQLADKLSATGGMIDQYTRYQGQVDIALDANKEQNESLNEKIQRMEDNIEKESTRMRQVFTALEKRVGELNSASNALTSALSGLQRK